MVKNYVTPIQGTLIEELGIEELENDTERD